MHPDPTLPLVLAIGGHDPSGGAGLQADIETLAAHGCRALTVVTALTTQSTCRVNQIQVQPPHQVDAQCRLLLEESRVGAIKIGLLGSAQVAAVAAALLADFPHIPVVLDPVLASGSGAPFADETLQRAIVDLLCPVCTLLTPNGPEARILTGEQHLDCCAAVLAAHGCSAALITGGHEADAQVINRLYDPTGLMDTYRWPRLRGSFHGSGCTLASAAAANLALGLRLTAAVERAQDYTWSCLSHGLATGRCQLMPNRFYGFAT
jgi:hydroxymethylpyrimidine/phosphomethylpyrimidine kinase